MKKIISFSLWGTNPKYTIGAIKNADLAEEIYPDWVCRYYVAQDVPRGVLFKLEDKKNVEIIQKNSFGNWKSMFWRFEPAGEEDVDVMISRDTDSRLNLREKFAVEEWLESDKGFHIMRDHPHHGYPVLGGMWGAKKNTIPNIKKLIQNFKQTDSYGTDYVFFEQEIIPLIKDNSLIHDEFFTKNAFPVKRNGYEFVGQVFDENDNTILEHTLALKEAI